MLMMIMEQRSMEFMIVYGTSVESITSNPSLKDKSERIFGLELGVYPTCYNNGGFELG